jgi:hypothetical protein
MAQRGADATIAIAFELVADRAHAGNDLGLVRRRGILLPVLAGLELRD